MEHPIHFGEKLLPKRYLVLDIETITDWNLVRRVFKLNDGCTQQELEDHLYAKYTSGFAPPSFHIPICIALIDVDCETCKVQNATVLESTDEKMLLQNFWKVSKQRKGKDVQTGFVTFNGRGFDLPCLFLRSLKHRVPVMKWERSRYALDWSHDICDDLSDFGAASKLSLDVLAKLLGLPGKTDVRGDQVETLYLQGEKERIKDYCMDDALTTYWIWLTVKYVRNEIKEEQYREAFDSAAETVRSCRAQTEHFQNEDAQRTNSAS